MSDSKYNYNILVIDDNQAVLRTLKLVLNGVFHNVVVFNNPTAVVSALENGNIDAVLLDMNFDASKLDGEEGLFWLNRIKQMKRVPAVILITAFADVSLAIKSMKGGADDFVTKPWDNDDLIQKIVKAIEKHKNDEHRDRMVTEANELRQIIEEERNMNLDEMERKHIETVLKEEEGNVTSAAQRLGINRQTLYNKIKKYDK